MQAIPPVNGMPSLGVDTADSWGPWAGRRFRKGLVAPRLARAVDRGGTYGGRAVTRADPAEFLQPAATAALFGVE
jgi:hypothetical protein